MPDYPIGANPIETGTLSFGFMDAAAKTAGVPLPFTATGRADEDFDAALIANTRAAIGNLSNAAAYKTEENRIAEIPLAFVTPLDEAHSSVVNRLNLNFGNIEGLTELVSIPAPDLSYFTAGGGAMIRPDAAAAAGTPAKVLSNSIAQIIAYLNIAMEPADPSWRLMNAYETTRGANQRGKPSSGRLVYAEEPETGELPSGAPDNLPAVGQQ